MRKPIFGSIEVHRFRGFGQFELSDLRQVNLLVGKNNCGKTSVLEAIQLLEDAGDAQALVDSLHRRGATRESADEPRNYANLEVRHLFNHPDGADRDNAPGGAGFRISGQGNGFRKQLKVSVKSSEDIAEKIDLFGGPPDFQDVEKLLCFEGSPEPAHRYLPLTETGTLSGATITHTARRRHRSSGRRVIFLTTDTESSSFLTSHWKNIALTEEEDVLLEGLNILDPTIERIALTSDSLRRTGKSGVIVRRKNEVDPVPLGIMGDGMWRMLTLILATVESKNSVLLIDEIDTGLHHSAMVQMWTLLLQTAKRLDVQLFATTHSSDCLNSLAQVIVRNGNMAKEISIQRIEAQKERSVVISGDELIIAAKRGTEIR